jgi:hypothetical protein
MRYIIGSIVELFGIVILLAAIMLNEIGIFSKRASVYLEKIADAVSAVAKRIAGEKL